MDAATRTAVQRLAPVTVVTGHYGVGKTSLVLNLALDAADAGYSVTVIDVDVVNPYFRASEYRNLLESHGVSLIAPVFAEAGTSLDVPSLTGAIIPAIQEAYHQPSLTGSSADQGTAGGKRVIIDAGGDEVGATALGRFAAAIEAGPHEVWYVVNANRSLTDDVDEVYGILRQIEARSRLEVTHVVSNAHLRHDTDLDVVQEGVPLARDVSQRAGVPLLMITVPQSHATDAYPSLTAHVGDDGIIYPVRLIVTLPWE